MKNDMMMPANYNALSEEELTYLCGGDGNDFLAGMGVPLLVVGAVSIGNMVWAISNTREWIKDNKRTDGDPATNVANLVLDGIDDTIAYASKSVWKSIVTVYTASNLATWWPVTAIAWLTV